MRHLPLLALAFVLFGCSDSPTQPTPVPPPTIVSYQGVWAGTWVRTNCTESGTAIGAGCANLPPSGGLRVTVAQAAANVNANLEIGSLPVTASGVVGTDGVMNLTGTGTFGGATVNVTRWQTRQANGAMSGDFRLSIVLPDGTGTTTLDATLQGVTKTS